LRLVLAAVVGVGVTLASACGAAGNDALSNSGGARGYVGNYGYDAVPGTTITPIDIARQRPGRPVTIGSLPSAMASTPDGRHLLVTAQGDDILAILDTSSEAVVARVPTGLEPDAVAVTPDGKTAVVANFGDGTVTPVDLATMTARRPIAVGNEPDAVAVTPEGKTAVVANFGDGTVTPVDLATQHAEPSVPVGPGPTGVAISRVSPGGGTVAWVAVGSSLVPVPLPMRVPGASVPVGHLGEALALGHDGHTLWVAGQDGVVIPVELTSRHAGRAVRVGGRPSSIAIAPPSR
jgi:YVTN family beta-propeller protein